MGEGALQEHMALCLQPVTDYLDRTEMRSSGHGSCLGAVGRSVIEQEAAPWRWP